jgi:hypothetical protein
MRLKVSSYDVLWWRIPALLFHYDAHLLTSIAFLFFFLSYVIALKLINTARIQNGLRHNDYQRYRRYCNSRLYRLRKCLHFTQGNKARYVKRNIDPELISQGR